MHFKLILILLFSLGTASGDENQEFPYFEGEAGVIVGEEYWVFDDTKDGSPYSRNEIIWDHDDAPKDAQKCAKKGYAQLRSWLEKKDSVISKYLNLIENTGGTTNFFLWTNDYKTLNAKRKSINARASRVWNWEGMFLKYESTLTPDGQCKIPNREEVIESLEEIAYAQEKTRRSDLNFIQRIFDGKRRKKFKNKITEIQNSPRPTGSREQ
jgi:hypothetical protein